MIDGQKFVDDKLFSKVFGFSYSDIPKLIDPKNHLSRCREKFNSMVSDLSDKESIIEYYKSAEFEIKQLYNFYKFVTSLSNNYKNPIAVNATSIFYREKNLQILDHGPGSFKLSIPLLEQGHSISVIEIKSRIFDYFYELLTRLYGNKVTFYPLLDEEKTISKITHDFDYIISSEVLEHVVFPEEVLNCLIHKLRRGGYMYLSTFFNDIEGKDPTHLKHNADKYNHCQSWHKLVLRKGLIPIGYNEGGSLKIWQRPYDTNYINNNLKFFDDFIDNRT